MGEFVVSDPTAVSSDTAGGAVWVFSLGWAEPVCVIYNKTEYNGFGAMLLAGDDLNGDKLPDIVIGACSNPPYFNIGGRERPEPEGYIAAYSGSDRSVLWSHRAPVYGSAHGIPMSFVAAGSGASLRANVYVSTFGAVCELSGKDGAVVQRRSIDDYVLTGAPHLLSIRSRLRVAVPALTSTSGSSQGALLMIDPESFKVESKIKSLSSCADWVSNAVPARDLNADGSDDLFVSTSGGIGCRSFVRAISGADGGVLWEKELPCKQSRRASIASGIDVDGDKTMDVVLGSFDPFGSPKICATVVMSGRTGASLLSLQPPASSVGGFFGCAVATVRDVTADGINDILVSDANPGETNVASASKVFLFSGKDGRLLREYQSPLSK